MKTYIKKIIIICVIGIIIYKMVPGIIFFACLFTDDGGKLDEWENVSDFVIENQDNLNRIVNEVLNDKMNIVIEQDEVIAHDNTIAEDESLLQNTEIAWLFENEYVKKIEIKEVQGNETIVFTTYTSGIVGSSQIIGFYYLNEDLEGNEHTEEQKIISNWYYFEEWN